MPDDQVHRQDEGEAGATGSAEGARAGVAGVQTAAGEAPAPSKPRKVQEANPMRSLGEGPA